MRSEHELQRTPLDVAAFDAYNAANKVARVAYWQQVHGVPPTDQQRRQRAAQSARHRAKKRAEKESQ